MSNPFNEERQQQLQDDAKELLEKFSKAYLMSFGMAMFLKAKAELEKDEDDPRKLQYREWDSIERPELFHDYAYMKVGAGPGDLSKWKKVYLAERQDYGIDVFESDKDYDKKKKPKLTIFPSGYHLERDVAWFFRWEMKAVASGLGMTDAELEVLAGFSTYSWALVHPFRPNFIFQLHKGKDPTCGCFGGSSVEPEGMGAEFAEDREKYLEAFDRCVSKCSVRDKESAKGMAFEMSCDQIRSNMDRLAVWQDDGTEPDMLTDALMLQCLVPMRDDMLADITGPASFKLPIWYKTRALVFVTLSKLVGPAWSAVQTGADKIAEQVEPVLKSGLGPILEVRSSAKDKIRTALVSKLGDHLAKGVTPFVDPIFKAFEEPLTKGFACCREVYVSHVEVSKLPKDTKEMRMQLDALPRTGSVVQDARKASYELVAPLRLLKKLSEEVFDSLDVWQIRGDAEMLLLSTLDAAIFTLENRIEEDGQKDEFKDEILKSYDHDVVLARAAFMKDITKSILIGNFMRLINPVTEPVVEAMNDVIPEPMQNVLNVVGLIDEIVDLFVGEPIEKVVDAAYPAPK